jgi:predicted ATP-dependent serine protease
MNQTTLEAKRTDAGQPNSTRLCPACHREISRWVGECPMCHSRLRREWNGFRRLSAHDLGETETQAPEVPATAAPVFSVSFAAALGAFRQEEERSLHDLMRNGACPEPRRHLFRGRATANA